MTILYLMTSPEAVPVQIENALGSLIDLEPWVDDRDAFDTLVFRSRQRAAPVRDWNLSEQSWRLQYTERKNDRTSMHGTISTINVYCRRKETGKMRHFLNDFNSVTPIGLLMEGVYTQPSVQSR